MNTSDIEIETEESPEESAQRESAAKAAGQEWYDAASEILARVRQGFGLPA